MAVCNIVVSDVVPKVQPILMFSLKPTNAHEGEVTCAVDLGTDLVLAIAITSRWTACHFGVFKVCCASCERVWRKRRKKYDR